MTIAGLFDLSGQTALVTGARRGIGLAMATGLAEAGADVIAASAQLEPAGSAVETAVRRAGRAYHGYQVDFGDREATRDFASQVVRDHPRIDILINNAGTISRFPAADYPESEWDRLLETDLSSAFVLTQAVARPMLERRHGHIVFTASLLSLQGGINVVAYTAAKSAIAGVTKALANEWAGRSVNVNAVVPGYIDTDNTQALRADPARNAAILDRIPAGRWGTPADFVGITVFLSSAASDYLHGTVIPVDGGWLGR